MNRLLIVVVGVLLAAAPAGAWPPTFGPEFNFSDDTMAHEGSGLTVNTPGSEAGRDRFMKLMKETCGQRGDCSIETLENHYGVTTYRVKYKDGYWFQISTDPGVVEVQAKPLTVDELKKYHDRIQDDVFGTAKKAGLDPATEQMGRDWAAGHIHVGAQSSGFLDDPKLFRNFMVDYANHPELSTGIYSYDHSNAPPLKALPERKQKRFWDIIRDFDKGRIKGTKKLAQAVNSDVYSVTVGSTSPPQKYQAFNVTRIASGDYGPEEQTVEIRGMRPQASIDDFISETELLQKRLEWLKARAAPVAPDLIDLSSLTDRQVTARFYDYVTETGLSFDGYKNLLSYSQGLYLGDAVGQQAERATARAAATNDYATSLAAGPRPTGWACVRGFWRRLLLRLFPAHAH